MSDCLVFVEWKPANIEGTVKDVYSCEGNIVLEIEAGLFSGKKEFITLQSGVSSKIDLRHFIGKECKIRNGLLQLKR